AELATRGAVRRVAEKRTPGAPCRISLTDAEAGEELLLVNYEHHPVDSPYRMRFAVYVRKGEEQYDAIDDVPEQLRLRTLAVRSFDTDAMMAGWELVEAGGGLEATIGRMFARLRGAHLPTPHPAPGWSARP